MLRESGSSTDLIDVTGETPPLPSQGALNRRYRLRPSVLHIGSILRLNNILDNILPTRVLWNHSTPIGRCHTVRGTPPSTRVFSSQYSSMSVLYPLNLRGGTFFSNLSRQLPFEKDYWLTIHQSRQEFAWRLRE